MRMAARRCALQILSALREQLAKFLDPGGSGLAAFESDEDPDLVEVEMEHAMFEAYDPVNGGSHQLPQIAFWQNHPKHQAAHFDFLKRDFARYERWSKEAQVAFIDHCRLTTEAVASLAAGLVGGGAPTGAEPGGLCASTCALEPLEHARQELAGRMDTGHGNALVWLTGGRLRRVSNAA